MISEVNRLIKSMRKPQTGIFIRRFVGNDQNKILYHPDPKKEVAKIRIDLLIKIISKLTKEDVRNEKKITILMLD